MRLAAQSRDYYVTRDRKQLGVKQNHSAMNDFPRETNKALGPRADHSHSLPPLHFTLLAPRRAMSHRGTLGPIESLARRLIHRHPHDRTPPFPVPRSPFPFPSPHVTDPASALHRCSPSILALLHASLASLLGPPPTQQDPTDALTTLRHLAHQKINTLPFHAVTPEWLRLYTDATLALVLARISRAHGPTGRNEEWKTWVRWLDTVIIVAGAVGPEREEYVAEVIAWVQRSFAREQVERFTRMAQREAVDDHGDDDDDGKEDLGPSTPRKRRKTCAPTPPAIHYAPLPIPTPSQAPPIPPSTPIILRAHTDASSCPAIHLWARPAYLLSRAGPGRHVPVEIGASYTDREWGQRVVPFEVFLRRVGYDLTGLCDVSADDGDGDLPRDQPVYLAQHDLLAQFPALRTDIGPLPDYIYTAPVMHDGRPYAPPGNEERLVMNVWVGSGGGTRGREVTSGVVSPAHTVSVSRGPTGHEVDVVTD